MVFEKPCLIAVMGPTGSGKSTLIDKLAPGATRVGNTMVSCTTDVTFVDTEVDGVRVTLIDTPGFDDTNASDTETLRLIANCLELGYKEKWLLNGLIYMHRITDNRVGGVAARNIRMFRTLCGEDALCNVILCTSMWDKVQWSANEAKAASNREAELKSDFWASMISHGSTVGRFSNSHESALELVRGLIPHTGVPAKLQLELAGGTPLTQTESGKLVSEDLRKLQEVHQREIESLRRDMALKSGLALQNLQKELEAEMKSLRQAKEAQEKLAKDREAEIKELRAKLKASRSCC